MAQLVLLDNTPEGIHSRIIPHQLVLSDVVLPFYAQNNNTNATNILTDLHTSASTTHEIDNTSKHVILLFPLQDSDVLFANKRKNGSVHFSQLGPDRPYHINKNNNNNMVSKGAIPSTSNSVSKNNENDDKLRIYGGVENTFLTANSPWIICPNTSANAQLGYNTEAVGPLPDSVESIRHRCNIENNNNVTDQDTNSLEILMQLLNGSYDRLFCEKDNHRTNEVDRNYFDLQTFLPQKETPEKVKDKDKSNGSKEVEEKKNSENSLLQWEEKSVSIPASNNKMFVELLRPPITTSTGHQFIKRNCDISDKKYTCKMCGKKYKYESNLVTHATVHTERALKCEYCNKKFGRKTNYVEHLRIHTNERPYKCRYCGKSFKQNHGWRDHERTHTNERPHVCEVCGKGFTVGHNLTVHKRIHTGEKPYGCRLCEKRFRQKSAYNAHMKNVHKMVNLSQIK